MSEKEEFVNDYFDEYLKENGIYEEVKELLDKRQAEDAYVCEQFLIEALRRVHAGDEYLPAWAIAILILKSSGRDVTKAAVLDEANDWADACALDRVKHISVGDEFVPIMAQLQTESGNAIKNTTHRTDMLINLKSAYNYAIYMYMPSQIVWLAAEMGKAETKD